MAAQNLPQAGQASILWYDLETFGVNPRRDSIAQFAAIRTDLELNPVAEPVTLFCRPGPSCLPSPFAVAVTGITPQFAQAQGVEELDFARQLHALFSQPGTTSSGYNSIRFDDEAVRFLFWRNLIEPYGREWQQGNARFDLLDVMRLAYALRPEGIHWPQKEDGRPSFKLEDLAAANGLLHSKAHDALSDVEATLALARLLKQCQPKLWQWAFGLRHKARVTELLLDSPGPVLHVSGRFDAQLGCLSAVLPICPRPSNGNEILCWDLRQDPASLLGLTAEQVRERLYCQAQDLNGQPRPGFKSVHLNKSPMLAPMSLLTPEISARWQLHLPELRQHYRTWMAHPELKSLCLDVFERPPSADVKQAWPLEALYGGFTDRQDQQRMQALARQPQPDWQQVRGQLSDNRLQAIATELQARYQWQSLSPAEQQKWQHAWRQHWLDTGLWTQQQADLHNLEQSRPELAEHWQQLRLWYQALAQRFDLPS